MGYTDEAISTELIEQKPSAELDDNQFDENSLPPYVVLDAILMRFMDERLDVADIMKLGARDGTDIVFVPNHNLSATEREELKTKPPFQRWWKNSFDPFSDEPAGVYYVTQDCVAAVSNQFFGSQFKREQACPGITITRNGFGDGHKYPIANSTSWLLEGTDDL
jgi:NH3-dependent NAD+ synthetase